MDALDEALEPRATEDRLLAPLAALPRVRLVVGTRKDRAGRTPLGTSAHEIDVDSERYFAERDLADFVRARLERLAGPGGSANAASVTALADRMASRSHRSFLYARVVSRWLAMTVLRGADANVLSAADVELPTDVLDAFGRDLDRFDEPTRRRIVDLLVPLAYAQGRGLPQKTVWQQLASAIAEQPYSDDSRH